MSRMQEITKEDVYDYMSDNNWHTVGDIALAQGCCKATVREKLKLLAKDKQPMISGNDGIKLVDADTLDEDIAREVEKMTRWMIAIVTRQALTAKPIKKLMLEARKLLPKSKEDKQTIRRYLVQLTHLIDFNEIDED